MGGFQRNALAFTSKQRRDFRVCQKVVIPITLKSPGSSGRPNFCDRSALTTYRLWPLWGEEYK
jgi:hypothetical protein